MEHKPEQSSTQGYIYSATVPEHQCACGGGCGCKSDDSNECSCGGNCDCN